MAMWAEEREGGRAVEGSGGEGKCALAVFNICSGEKEEKRE